MSATSGKYPPFPPSSLLLQKRWQEKDYLLHRDRVHSLRGNQAFKPDFKKTPKSKLQLPANVANSNESLRMHIAVPSVHQATYSLVNGFDPHPNDLYETKRRHPFTAREDFNYNAKDSAGDDPRMINDKLLAPKHYFSNGVDHKRPSDDIRPKLQRPFTSKDRTSISKEKQIGIESKKAALNRPLTSKESSRRSILKTNPKKSPISSRKIMFKTSNVKERHCSLNSETPQVAPIKKPKWMLSMQVKPGNSQYNRDILEQDFQKHRYYQLHNLRQGKHDDKKVEIREFSSDSKDPSDDNDDDEEHFDASCYSDEASLTTVSRTPSPSPSPTLSPTPSSTLSMDEEVSVARQPTIVDGTNWDLNPFAHLKPEDMLTFDIDPHSGNKKGESDDNRTLISEEIIPLDSAHVPHHPSTKSSDEAQDYFVPKTQSEALPQPLLLRAKKDFNVENYIPPSHVLKIAKDSEQISNSDSESSEGEPRFVIKDGKQGKYILKNDTLIPASSHIFKKRSRKKSKVKNIREIHYIDYNKESGPSEDDEDILDDEFVKKLLTIKEDRRYSRRFMDKKEDDSRRGSIRKPFSRKSSLLKEITKVTPNEEVPPEITPAEDQSQIVEEDSDASKDVISEEKDAQQSQPNEDDLEKATENDDEMNGVDDEGTEGETDEITEDEELLVSQVHGTELEDGEGLYCDIANEATDDTEREFDSNKQRARPSSSMYDYLPPLNPDPVLDEGDINKCKTRLCGDTVIIREALNRNERSDLETVVNVIIANNTDNRRWLRKLYRDEYLQSLLLDIRKNLPADIASVISYMMIPICEFDAMCLWDALKGLHKDPEVLCEILCTRTNKELKAIKEAYLLRYAEELLDHIEDETIGVFQKILVRLALGERDVEELWNKNDCAKEAKAIAALLEVKGLYLEKKLIDVFCSHSLEMLRVVLTEYRKHKGNDLDQDIVKIMKGNFCRAVITILHYISNPPNYFVEKLHNSHFKGNDDDKSLCRIIISRAESDLDMIKTLFSLRYGMQLHHYIDQVCHGSLKGLALRLISANVHGEERSFLDFPPLWPGDEDIELIQRLTLEDVIQIMIRKAKFLSKGQKIITLRREKQREAEEAAESSDSAESEPDDDLPDVPAPDNPVDSEEEEERAQKEAQRELRDGLKNISFADEVQVHEDGGGAESYKSVFTDVSFAAASRGILKVAQEEEGKGEQENEEELDAELEEEFGHLKPNWPKVTQLNGPVLDPTFSGRQELKRKKTLIQRSRKKTFRGTVCGISMDQFNALRDAQAIGKAMLQKNRNMEGIIQFLTTRNNAQRQLIIREFFRRYRRDLVDDLRVLTPMNEEIILSLLLSGEVYDAASLYAHFNHENLTVTIDGLIEILLTRQNDEILIMKRAFNGIFGLDLREEIQKKTKNHFTKLLLTIADCQRDQSTDTVDSYMAKKDAQSLFEAIRKKPTNYDLFIEIFALRSFAHIEAVCDHYPEIAHVDVLEDLDNCLRGGFLEAIITIICMVRDTAMFFCERIYRSVSYEPQNFAMLIRCIIGRCEIDLQVIKQTFRRTYGRTIFDLVDKECDFASKKILLGVIKK